MSSLYKIDTDLLEVLEQAELEAINCDGEFSEVLYQKISALRGNKEIKIGKICKFYKSLLAEGEMVKAEAKNLTDRATACKRKAESLKKYLDNSLQGNTFSDEVSKISYRNSQSVNVDIDKEYKSNPEFVNTKVVESWDKTALKKAIKNGVKIDGVELKINVNIQIK